MQAQIGVFPVGRVEALCEVALDAVRSGDWYVTWPSLYRPMQLVACLAPEVMSWISYALYKAEADARGRGAARSATGSWRPPEPRPCSRPRFCIRCSRRTDHMHGQHQTAAHATQT